jgi:hypothetical protein
MRQLAAIAAWLAATAPLGAAAETPAPQAAPPPESAPPAPSAAPAHDSEIDPLLAAGIAFDAVGVASIIVGVVAAAEVHAVQEDESFHRYAEGFTQAQDICDEAEAGSRSPAARDVDPADIVDRCEAGHRWERVEMVMLPIGALAVITGTVLIGSSFSARGTSSAVRVLPAVSPGAAFVAVETAF